MLLTLKPPLQNGIKSPHDYHTTLSSSFTARYSPPVSVASLPPVVDSSERRMSTPHRGLPPPAAMTLPPPDRGPPAPMAPLGQLPAPPSQWQGADESMRNWLQAKAEEDRRKQEEERTRQEGLRLDQRKIEQTMLRESLQGGVPPYMVPLIFAGMGGGNLPNASLEWAQHYMAQMSLQTQQQTQQQQQQQVQQQQHQLQHQHQQHQQPQQQQIQQAQQVPQQQQVSPDMRRDSRMIPPNPYGAQQPLQPSVPAAPVQPGQQLPSQSSQSTFGRPPAPLQSAPTSAPRHQLPPGTLPRLNTAEMQIQAPPTGGQLPGQALHPLQQSQSTQQDSQQQSSPSIYFHHWVPPNQSSSNPGPSTPSGKSQHESPYSQTTQSHLRSDYQNSPKKRKLQGSHQSNAAPTTSQHPDTSPPFSQTSSRGRTPPESRRPGAGHMRHRSDASSRGYDALHHRASSRQRQQSSSGGAPPGAPGGANHSGNRTPATNRSSVSGDEPSLRMSAQSETRQSHYSAGPEMSQVPKEESNT